VTVTNNVGAAELLRKYLESPAGSNLLAQMLERSRPR
jgi:hypothetical protein